MGMCTCQLFGFLCWMYPRTRCRNSIPLSHFSLHNLNSPPQKSIKGASHLRQTPFQPFHELWSWLATQQEAQHDELFVLSEWMWIYLLFLYLFLSDLSAACLGLKSHSLFRLCLFRVGSLWWPVIIFTLCLMYFFRWTSATITHTINKKEWR